MDTLKDRGWQRWTEYEQRESADGKDILAYMQSLGRWKLHVVMSKLLVIDPEDPAQRLVIEADIQRLETDSTDGVGADMVNVQTLLTQEEIRLLVMQYNNLFPDNDTLNIYLYGPEAGAGAEMLWQ